MTSFYGFLAIEILSLPVTAVIIFLNVLTKFSRFDSNVTTTECAIYSVAKGDCVNELQFQF